jgi:hypothetical protein
MEKEMHLFDQRILGFIILFLLGMLVAVKRMTTGSILDQPKGNFMVRLVNLFNLFFSNCESPGFCLADHSSIVFNSARLHLYSWTIDFDGFRNHGIDIIFDRLSLYGMGVDHPGA